MQINKEIYVYNKYKMMKRKRETKHCFLIINKMHSLTFNINYKNFFFFIII